MYAFHTDLRLRWGWGCFRPRRYSDGRTTRIRNRRAGEHPEGVPLQSGHQFGQRRPRFFQKDKDPSKGRGQRKTDEAAPRALLNAGFCVCTPYLRWTYSLGGDGLIHPTCEAPGASVGHLVSTRWTLRSIVPSSKKMMNSHSDNAAIAALNRAGRSRKLPLHFVPVFGRIFPPIQVPTPKRRQAFPGKLRSNYRPQV